MGASAHTKMVNGRVDERAAVKASRVLGDKGLTISSFIRNSIEHVARTGVVPECGFAHSDRSAGVDDLRAFVKELNALPMPGKQDYPTLSEDELVERLRMERYGY